MFKRLNDLNKYNNINNKHCQEMILWQCLLFMGCNCALILRMKRLFEHIHKPALYGIGTYQDVDELLCCILLVGILQP